MNDLPKCPRCGADYMDSTSFGADIFRCGSRFGGRFADGTIPVDEQSKTCRIAELEAEVKHLKQSLTIVLEQAAYMAQTLYPEDWHNMGMPQYLADAKAAIAGKERGE